MNIIHIPSSKTVVHTPLIVDHLLTVSSLSLLSLKGMIFRVFLFCDILYLKLSELPILHATIYLKGLSIVLNCLVKRLQTIFDVIISALTISLE